MNQKWLLLCCVLLFLTSCTQKGSETALLGAAVAEVYAPDKYQDTLIPVSNHIDIANTGFYPKMIAIKAGERVTFVNQDKVLHWPASNMHPVHTTYPDSDIEKCGTNEEKNIFDACGGIAAGDSYTFAFSEKGRWPYHDHLHPKLIGTIVVE